MTAKAPQNVSLYKRYLKRQLNLFYLSLTFFTRIPAPKNMYYSPSLLNKSGRYFSLIGLLIAGILSIIFTVIFILLMGWIIMLDHQLMI